jgi:hypothetical protein
MTTRLEHLLGNLPGRARSLKLAGGDRFFNERADHVPTPGLRVGDQLADRDFTAGPLVYEMKHLQGRIGQHEAERLAIRSQQRKRP